MIAQPSLDELRAEALEWGRKPRAFGAWYVTEHMVRAMRAYGWTIIVGALGQPILYLLGLAVGLAALIDAPVAEGGVEVPYLVFVAPALLMTSTIAVASEEFTYPVMAGFKWRRYFFGFSASALSPSQIATGVVFGATARMIVVAVAYTAFLYIFGAIPDLATGWLSIFIAILAGLAFGIPLMAYAASDRRRQGPVRARSAVHLHADVPVLRHVLPARPPCRCGCSGSAGSRRCGTRPRSGGG